MKFTKEYEYALEFLLLMMSYSKEKPLCIYKTQGLPRKFMERIANKLRKAKIVSAHRGRAGGYYLEQDPIDITLFMIYSAIVENKDEASVEVTKEGRKARYALNLAKKQFNNVLKCINLKSIQGTEFVTK